MDKQAGNVHENTSSMLELAVVSWNIDVVTGLTVTILLLLTFKLHFLLNLLHMA